MPLSHVRPCTYHNSSLKCRAFRGALATTKEGRLGPFWKLRNPSLHVIFIKTYFSSSHPPFPSMSRHTLLSYKPHIPPYPPSEYLHISTWKVGGFRHDSANNHLRGCTASSLLLSNWPPNSVKCIKPYFFLKSFQSKTPALSALCEPTQPRHARVVHVRYLLIPWAMAWMRA
jgi:hypothetical protein